MTEKIEFLATIPSIQTAIRIFGDGDGMRFFLEVPKSEMGNAIGIAAMTRKVLRVTVETEENQEESTYGL